jgi:hypothetical protein
MEMEVRLQKAMDQKKAEELRAATEQILPRSRIATPRSRPGTRTGATPRTVTGSTPRQSFSSTPRSRPRGL